MPVKGRARGPLATGRLLIRRLSTGSYPPVLSGGWTSFFRSIPGFSFVAFIPMISPFSRLYRRAHALTRPLDTPLRLFGYLMIRFLREKNNVNGFLFILRYGQKLTPPVWHPELPYAGTMLISSTIHRARRRRRTPAAGSTRHINRRSCSFLSVHIPRFILTSTMESPTISMSQTSEGVVHPDPSEPGHPSQPYPDENKFINLDDWQKTEPTLTDMIQVRQVQEDPFIDPNSITRPLMLYPSERVVLSQR